MSCFPNVRIVSIVISLLAAGTACSGSSAPSSLRVQLAAEPVSLDPALAEDGVSLRVLANVMEGLVGYDGAGTLQNRLAESYRISPDGKRYEFLLRKAFWSDGRRVLPEDFVRALRRTLGHATRSKLAGMLFSIRGAREFHAGEVPPDRLGVKEEDGKLIVELDRPTPYFIQALTLPVALPSRQEVWAESTPVTGPYRIASHILDQKLILEKNPYYYGPAPKIPVIELRIVQDESTGANLFENGKIDLLTKVPWTHFEKLKKEGVLRTDPFMATYFLAFNLKKAPFDQRDWRRAVAGSIHRDEIVTMLGSGETPARSWIPRGLEGYEPYADPAPVFRDSVEKIGSMSARREVSAAFDTGSRNGSVMEKVQRDLRKNLNLQLSLLNLDWKMHVKTLQSDAHPISRFGWQAPFMDPISHLRPFVTGDPNNFSGFSNRTYDDLVRKIEEARPGSAREKLVREAQRIIVEYEAVVIPLYHYVQSHAVAKRVSGFRVNPFGVIRFDELTVK